MTNIERKAGVIWNGGLKNGDGVISTESQTLFEQPYNSKTRFGDETGTNPEELIAAANAACLDMAFASTMEKNGFHPKKTETNATCTLSSRDNGYEITSMQLHLRAEVSDIKKDKFQELAKQAEESCPVSKLLRAGLEIDMDATLV